MARARTWQMCQEFRRVAHALVGGEDAVHEAWRAIVEHSTDALSWHGSAGVFRYVSPGFTELFGYRPHDVIGRDPVDLVHADDVDHVVGIYRDLSRGRRSFRVTCRVRRVDHTYIWVESTGRVAATGLEGGVVTVTRDIEARRSLLEALAYEERLREGLEVLAQQQEHFVTAVAHRARTPMTAVLGFAHTLRRAGDQLDPGRREQLLDRLVANAAELAEVIEVATSLDGASHMQGAIMGATCRLPEMVADAVAVLADGAAPITLDLDPAAETLHADATKLDRALRAMLRNAIVHTPPHTPITIRTRREGSGVTITVADAGDGVRDELKRTIFEPFTKGDSYLAHDPGLGLGLSLVARIAADHGGRAWVTDAEEGGAAFHLYVADPHGPAGARDVS